MSGIPELFFFPAKLFRRNITLTVSNTNSAVLPKETFKRGA
jgi:hypothetical protein